MVQQPAWAESFHSFCGEERLQKFAIAIWDRYQEGSLAYWQEILVKRFSEEAGLEVEPTLEELFRACWAGLDPEDPETWFPSDE